MGFFSKKKALPAIDGDKPLAAYVKRLLPKTLRGDIRPSFNQFYTTTALEGLVAARCGGGKYRAQLRRMDGKYTYIGYHTFSLSGPARVHGREVTPDGEDVEELEEQRLQKRAKAAAEQARAHRHKTEIRRRSQKEQRKLRARQRADERQRRFDELEAKVAKVEKQRAENGVMKTPRQAVMDANRQTVNTLIPHTRHDSRDITEAARESSRRLRNSIWKETNRKRSENDATTLEYFKLGLIAGERERLAAIKKGLEKALRQTASHSK